VGFAARLTLGRAIVLAALACASAAALAQQGSGRYSESSSQMRRLPPAPPALELLPPGQVRPAVGATGTAPVQRPPASATEFALDAPCSWLPDSRGSSPTDQGSRETAAESAALREHIGRIGAFFKTQATIGPAAGICPVFVNSGSMRRLGADFALTGFFGVGFWPAELLSRRNGRIVFDGEIGHAWADVNLLRLDGSRLIISDARGEMFEDVAVTHRMQGFAVYRGQQFIVTRNDRPLFRPTAKGRLLRWQLDQIAQALPPARAQAEREAARLREATSPEQAARDEEIIQQRAQRSFGGDLARARASWQAERSAELERLRARADVTRPEHPVAVLLRLQADTQARLAALAAEQASAPACLSPPLRGTTVPDVLAVDDPHCVHPMVEANPEHFDRTLPRSAIQVISFRLFDLDPAAPNAKKDRAARAVFFWGVDWQRLRREVLGGP
jgi:hypothetical protein